MYERILNLPVQASDIIKINYLFVLHVSHYKYPKQKDVKSTIDMNTTSEVYSMSLPIKQHKKRKNDETTHAIFFTSKFMCVFLMIFVVLFG